MTVATYEIEKHRVGAYLHAAHQHCGGLAV